MLFEHVKQIRRKNLKRYWQYNAKGQLSMHARKDRWGDSVHYLFSYYPSGEIKSKSHRKWHQDSLIFLENSTYLKYGANYRLIQYDQYSSSIGDQLSFQEDFFSQNSPDSSIFYAADTSTISSKRLYTDKGQLRIQRIFYPRWKTKYDYEWQFNGYYWTMVILEQTRIRFWQLQNRQEIHLDSLDRIRGRSTHISNLWGDYEDYNTYQYDSSGYLISKTWWNEDRDSTIHHLYPKGHADFGAYEGFGDGRRVGFYRLGFCFQPSQISLAETSSHEAQVFPNPFEQNLQISLSRAQGFKILDASGKLHRSGQLNAGQQQLDLADLQPGLYLLYLGSGKEMQVQKIIKR